MSTKDAASNSSDDVECPTCGRTDFKNKTGMRMHHSKAHGESIATIDVECELCGEPVERHKDDVEKTEHSFCSQSCESKWREMNWKGEDHPGWKGLKSLICECCGDEFSIRRDEKERKYCSDECVQQGRSDQPHKNTVSVSCTACGAGITRKASAVNDERNFCDMGCFGDYLSENGVGESNPNYKGKESVECETCESVFHVRPSVLERSTYCSWECKIEGQRCSDGSFFANGLGYQIAPNWSEQRCERLERDNYECSICGVANEDHLSEYGQSLHVHHIVPRRKFVEDGEYDYESANRLDNLITLCKVCHRRWEGIPVIPQ